MLLAEVKRQRKSFDAAKFECKVQLVTNKLFAIYHIETACLTLENMQIDDHRRRGMIM